VEAFDPLVDRDQSILFSLGLVIGRIPGSVDPNHLPKSTRGLN
jgi:hypothetical protein